MKKFIIFCMICVFAFGINSPQDPYFKDTNTTCPIKFIDVFKSPKFIAVLEYSDGEKVLFSSVKPMFYYFYKISSSEHFVPIKKILVSDFESGDLIEASEAFFVFGSRIMSASGDDLIPFDTYEKAEKFVKANSGHKILQFKDITKKLIEYLE